MNTIDQVEGAAGRRVVPVLPALTGLRAVAALSVLLFHRRAYFAEWPSGFRAVIDSGYVGVGLFFVLSGFVLAYSQFGMDQGRVGRTAFWSARVGRVYPVYLLGLVVSFPLFAHQVALGGAVLSNVANAGLNALASTLLLQAWWPPFALAWNDPGWSLSVEAFFYALFPWLLTWIVRLSRTGQVVFALAAIAVPLVVASAATLFLGDAINDGATVWFKILTFNPVLRLPEFVVGVIAGAVFTRERALVARISRQAQPMAGGVAVVAALLMAQSSSIPRVFLQGPMLLPIWSALIFCLACVPSGGGPLSHPWMQRAGERSYAFYILHQPVYFGVAFLAATLGVPIEGSGVALVCYVLICAWVASLAHAFVERPLRRRLALRLRGCPAREATLNPWCAL